MDIQTRLTLRVTATMSATATIDDLWRRPIEVGDERRDF
jgi:hypothetical protein